MTRAPETTTPTILLIPGLGDARRGHWQSAWARERPDCVKVDLGEWDDPSRNVWLSRIDQAIAETPGRVILAAHGLGCIAVAWWAGLLGAEAGRRVQGALLVAPADPAARFGPAPTAMLPFPSIVAAPHEEAERARGLAAEWLSDFYDLGHVGSRLGSWAPGQRLLEMLIENGPGLSHYAYRREPPMRPASSRPVAPRNRPVSERF